MRIGLRHISSLAATAWDSKRTTTVPLSCYDSTSPAALGADRDLDFGKKFISIFDLKKDKKNLLALGRFLARGS